MAKSVLRTEILSRLASLTQDQVRSLSGNIACAVTKLEQWRAAKHVALFLPMKTTEVDTMPLVNAARSSKCIYVPLHVPMASCEMSFVRLGNNHHDYCWETRRHVPPSSEPLLDLIIVPGVAFDQRGNRLGRGKGYFDRYLAKTAVDRTLCLAVAFDEQIVDNVPVQDHDISVDIIVTPTRVISCTM